MKHNPVNPKKGLNYGVIGNGTSAALISHTGSMDFLCLPYFNSPSLFCRLLDDQRGGSFSIEVGPQYSINQQYIRNTNILATQFRSDEGNFNIIDFMPRFKHDGNYNSPSEVVRLIRYKGGKPRFKVHYDPRLVYSQYETYSENKGNYIKSNTHEGSYESAYLYSNFTSEDILQSREIELKNDGFFLISYNQKILEVNMDSVYLDYSQTKVYWLEWSHRTVTFEKYNDHILRSALVLKLLNFQKTGAIIAAVTTSLPVTVGEERNWDYRFCWIRDSSMIIQVLFQLRHYRVAKRFLQFIIDAIPYKDEKVQIMYGIRGEKDLTEKSLEWLKGYKDSRPVRIGNGAYHQKQIDIYGVLLDVIYRSFQYFGSDVENAEDLWTITRSLVRTVSQNWEDADMGIWEFRSQKQHFVFSKVLCWVALNRGAMIAQTLGMQEYFDKWEALADEIKKDIMDKGWNEKVGAFTQAYENKALDAANLLMAPYGFIDPMDPRYVSTVKLTEKELCRDGLMYRYKNTDDFGLPKSSFTVCTFWLIKALFQTGETH
jgi:GH15 family glucan-1,4-alpha-glucosidase